MTKVCRAGMVRKARNASINDTWWYSSKVALPIGIWRLHLVAVATPIGVPTLLIKYTQPKLTNYRGGRSQITAVAGPTQPIFSKQTNPSRGNYPRGPILPRGSATLNECSKKIAYKVTRPCTDYPLRGVEPTNKIRPYPTIQLTRGAGADLRVPNGTRPILYLVGSKTHREETIHRGPVVPQGSA